jgi:hypothetical protein
LKFASKLSKLRRQRFWPATNEMTRTGLRVLAVVKMMGMRVGEVQLLLALVLEQVELELELKLELELEEVELELEKVKLGLELTELVLSGSIG